MFRSGLRAVAALLSGVALCALLGCQSPGRVVRVGGPTAAPSSASTGAPTDATPTTGPSTSVRPSPGETSATEPTTPAPSGTPTEPAAPNTPTPSTPTRPPAERVEHVVAISVDGLNPDAITRLGESRAPTLHRMLRDGASTLNARTTWEQTRTLPNHTAMLTGRRVDAGSGGHGYDINTDDGSTVERKAGRYVPSVFDVVHDGGGRTALFTAKEKFAVYSRTWNRDGAEDRTGSDDGRAKIDRFVIDTDDDRLTRELTAELGRRPPTFTFVHLAAPDEEGHDSGFMGARYLEAVARTDANVGRILRAVGTLSSLRDDTAVILTADHGGRGTTHDEATSSDNYRIPFLVWGADVGVGDLYALNRDYRDPGSDRSDYAGPQPVRNADLANLSTDLLGLPAVPGSEFDRDQDLDVTG